jgi:hypothetical protein
MAISLEWFIPGFYAMYLREIPSTKSQTNSKFKIQNPIFMKKLILSMIMILLESSILAQDGGRSYCAAIGGGNWEHIVNITVGTINHSSGYSVYSDFTSFSTNLPSEGVTVIIVTLGNPYLSDNVGAWIDWNQDGVFNEAMITFSGTPATHFTGNIVVPPGAIYGSTRLRIRMMDGIDLQPCGSTMYGEVEDYTVMVPEIAHPEITVEPLAVNTFIAGNNSVSQETVRISNTGNGDLDWNASLSCDVVENHCLDFNGLNQYVHVDQSFPSFTQYTLEFWRYSNGTSTSGWPRMITMVQNPDHSGDCIVIEHTNSDQNTLEITVNDGMFNNYKAYIDLTPYQNQWVHLAMTYNGSMTTFYINGQVIDNKSSVPATFNLQSTQIGGCVMPLIGLYRYFNGRLDEIRFWNVARTQQQIQDCMDSTFCEPQAGMMAYWKLNENSGSLIMDETGNMPAGIIENNAQWYTPGAPLNNDCIPPVPIPVVDISPVSGTIPPGGFADVSLTFHSGNLPLGVYNSCNLFINSNDFDESKITVPLTVSITNQQAVVPISDWAVVLGVVLMVGVVVWYWRRS